MFRTAILTISDRVSAGKATDGSGPVIQSLLSAQKNGDEPTFMVKTSTVVPDELELIQKHVLEWTDTNAVDLIITTGGTGFGQRDVTQQAVMPLLHKHATGLQQYMYQEAFKSTKLASLSCGIAGSRHSTLILTLPGSSKACKENLGSVIDILPHALNLLRGENAITDSFHSTLHSGHVSHSCTHHTRPESQDKGKATDSSPAPSRKRESPFPMISFENALALISQHVKPLRQVIDVPSSELAGFVLAQDLFSPSNIPAFRSSVVDGYAVRSQDGPGTYPVLDTSLAAPGPMSSLEPKSVIRIMTGAPVPQNADAVVMVEDTFLLESQDGIEKLVSINTTSKSGQFIRNVGSDVHQGQLLFPKHTIFSSFGFESALLHSVEISKVPVYRKPVVAIMSTGNEVFPETTAESDLPFGAIRDANRPALKIVLESQDYIVKDLGIVKDSREELNRVLSTALDEADLIITTGGVSMGALDLLKPILVESFKAELHFGRVFLKPGKPTTFATMMRHGSSVPVFALPGNPVSALVTYHLFVTRALRILSGLPVEDAQAKIMVEVQSDISLDSRPEFRRVRIVPGTPFTAHELESAQQSSRLLSFRGANGLLCLPPKSETKTVMRKGDACEALLFHSL